MAGHTSPALTSQEPLHSVWLGILRQKAGTESVNKVAPVLTENLRLLIEHLPREDPDSPTSPLRLSAQRDRALLLVGFAGALRRSELVGLDTGDIAFGAEGLRLVVRKSKTDQQGKGHVKGLRYGEHSTTCPVRALRTWLRAGVAGIKGKDGGCVLVLASDKLSLSDAREMVASTLRRKGMDGFFICNNGQPHPRT